MSEDVVIIGAGGFAREVLDVFNACNEARRSYNVVGYVVESEYGAPGVIVNDKPILGDFGWLSEHRREVSVTCAVGAPQDRRRLIKTAQLLGCQFVSVIHPSAILTRWVTLGEGVVIAAGCILTNRIHIGNQVHINLSCTIAHDAALEDFVTLAPGVHVSGKVILSTGCYIGTGANIIDKMHVGEWSIVGAGSTIFNDVSPNSTVIGVPGRMIMTREAGWHLGDINHEG